MTRKLLYIALAAAGVVLAAWATWALYLKPVPAPGARPQAAARAAPTAAAAGKASPASDKGKAVSTSRPQSAPAAGSAQAARQAAAALPASTTAAAAPRAGPLHVPLQAAAAEALPPAAAASATAARGGAQALGCLIEASAVADVGTPVVGVIEEVLAERGDFVKRGQVLAHHESRVERAAVTLAQQKVANTAELRAAESHINFAHKKAERTAKLTELNYVSGQAREQAETEAVTARMRLAQAVEQRELALKELEMARAQLQQRTLVSPLNGVVVDRLVSPGERVENRPVFRIAQIDPLRVEVVLPAALFGRIQVGATARVVADLPGSAPSEARVAIVDRVIDASSNTFRTRLSLPNPSQQLPAGVRCRVEFGR
jgi:membrane fusion protein, heavy metal efflux system